MTGRGIDQVLRFPSEPTLHEPYVLDARDYVELAERKSGRIPRPVEPGYPWGDALRELATRRPAVWIVNLETAFTRSDRWENKGINYRMNPRNIECLNVARVDCCVLSNNHVLDWGTEGLEETLRTLREAGIATAGAGMSIDEAKAPAILDCGERGRVLVFGLGSPSSGIPLAWEASAGKPGVRLLKAHSKEAVLEMRDQVLATKQRGDIVIASIHWGDNWGYEIPHSQREFARGLIDLAGVDLVHGHSSHHAKGFELYRGKLILYGCGDFITDYEGISGYEEYRGDLSVLYFPRLSTERGELLSLQMVPFREERFRLARALVGEVEWLRRVWERDGIGLSGELRTRDGIVELVP